MKIMSKEEMKIAKKLADAFNALPESKKEYLLGFAEGVAAVGGSNPAEKEDKDQSESTA